MHPVVVENLEEYLADSLTPGTRRTIEAHLNACAECREELGSMQEISRYFPSLRPVEAIEPGPDFAARVMGQVVRRPVALWNLFDAAFGRRVVLASLLTLAVLGSYLITREKEYAPGPVSPEAVMAADQDRFGEPVSDRDMMLVTLTSYEP